MSLQMYTKVLKHVMKDTREGCEMLSSWEKRVKASANMYLLLLRNIIVHIGTHSYFEI